MKARNAFNTCSVFRVFPAIKTGCAAIWKKGGCSVLINSHHKMYQSIQPDSLDDCCVLAVRLFVKNLELDAIELFPPYGVG